MLSSCFRLVGQVAFCCCSKLSEVAEEEWQDDGKSSSSKVDSWCLGVSLDEEQEEKEHDRIPFRNLASN